MTREEMIAAIDGEIGRLEEIRGLLSKSHSERFTLSEGAPASQAAGAVKKRVLSAEARRSIAAAQKRRWAKKREGEEPAETK